ncbi:patatin-like phospholipase family protein [Aureisphaera galaxeae]|uniref:patatin-like phospholipase family protein n=1 Tax=Aureisphaera galaxeae TaxID=1538023 RepID=UPI0023501030|nr:patatin-like phospholipase family protein [Aureisphaera galaxeae]MDC8004666.1 patatin-like phospholipase family protein [Aureisphaera galaxeae]
MSLFLNTISFINKAKKSIKNFLKSSFLSLLIIVIILLLLTQMDQALTMMVDLIENNGSRFSLFLAFVFINGLAIVLSHYPIYNYYASNLNNSQNYTTWRAVQPFKIWPLKYFEVYVFTTRQGVGYIPDNWANYLRYLIGLLIHFVWIHYIITSFEPNIIFENFPLGLLKGIVYVLLIVPFVLYIILKEKFSRYKKTTDAQGNPLTPSQLLANSQKLDGLHKRLGIYYFIVALLSMLLLIITLFAATFSPLGLIILLLTSYAFVFNYVFFRLLRTRLSKVKDTLQSAFMLPVYLFIKGIQFLEKSENYLGLFNINFLAAVVLLLYTTLGSIFDWGLHNGIPILLAFFYFYYFIIASLSKYFFVSRKLKLFGTRKFKIIFTGILLFVLLFVTGKLLNAEVTTHELDIVETSEDTLSEEEFLTSLANKDGETFFFIASHGGGLKANVWTLNVLNTLQQETEGRLLDNTVALSGASGGSLGLALYTGLYRKHGKDTTAIQKKIDSLSHQNFTSIDISLTFGLDTYRKLWPLNQRIGVRDRPYYKMRKYQNNIEGIDESVLSEKPFRQYWNETFQKTGYFPSLIMNTAGTKGSRGILWSVKQKDFNSIFPFAENLADLNGNKTLPFYQAVSTTNRFPVFSPAAKISGYGHYIDAGAIDNSGLLGCLDLHNYLMRNTALMDSTKVAYIEIINSKSLYTNYLVEKFKKKEYLPHINKNEVETDNIVADLQTGLNLDKIPGYLSDYLSNWEASNLRDVRYFQLFMPHKVTLDDVEAFLGGSINDAEVKSKLKNFLTEENDHILAVTEGEDGNSFNEAWKFYEPTLSRHLSGSSINYVHHILEHRMLQDQFKEIKRLTEE